jgi:hypothetical protein
MDVYHSRPNPFEFMNLSTEDCIQRALQSEEIVDIAFCLSNEELALASRTFNCIAANCDDSAPTSAARLRASIQFAIVAGRTSAGGHVSNYRKNKTEPWLFDLLPLTCIDFVYRNLMNELLLSHGCDCLRSLAIALSKSSRCQLTPSRTHPRFSQHSLDEEIMVQAVRAINSRKCLGREHVLHALLLFAFEQVRPEHMYFVSWTGSRLFDLVSRDLIKIGYRAACTDFRACLATLRQGVPRLPLEGSLFIIEQILESGIHRLDE